MTIDDQAEQIVSRQQLAEFIDALADDLKNSPQDWENKDLEDFLRALGRWTNSMQNYYASQDRAFDEAPKWAHFADMLLGAKVYE